VLKDFFKHFWLIDEADDAPFQFPQGGEQLVEPHLTLALGTGKGICFIDLSDEIRPTLF